MGERTKPSMNDKWRPAGWDNPYSKLDDYYRENQMADEAYEAGADAMMEAIWEMAKESPTGTFTFDTHAVTIL